MNITFNQYILNPQLKSNAVLNATAREAIRGNYIKKYNAILLRERGKINYFLYYDKRNNRYYGHFKIPSETVNKFYYDVVLEFFADENVSNTEDLFKYYIKFYSNDPAFVYTHAHAFNTNDLFISELSSKMSRKALKKEAVEKNPSNQIGYVKTIYFAYLYMKEKGLNDVSKFKGEANSFSKIGLLSKIEKADKKIEDREAEGAKLQKIKKNAKDKNKLAAPVSKTITPNLGVKKTKTVNTVKSVKTVKKRK
jgi:hypothetical protein